MSKDVILVLATPGAPQLTWLEPLRRQAEIVVGNSAEDFSKAACGATVIFNWSGSLPLLRKVFLMSPNLRWVHSFAAGVDRTLFPELVAGPVPLTNGTGVFSASLGEFTLSAILYFAKDFRRMVRNQMAGVWEQFDIIPIEGQTVGIVGYGDIGRAVASRAKAMGMRVLAVRRHVPRDSRDDYAEEIFAPEQLVAVLPRCDYIAVTAPLTPETRGMLGEREFAAMRKTAVVINVGRGPVIDERALIAALSERRIKGAAVDVFDEEPLPAGHPFYRLENVLLSPHCADHTPDWMDNAMKFFLDQYARFRKGEPLLNIVDKRLGY
jgi:phosphoglycerate dehydrogenase-like enzyme